VLLKGEVLVADGDNNKTHHNYDSFSRENNHHDRTRFNG